MKAVEAKKPSDEFVFSGGWLKNEDKITPKKSIVICGITRGGTSFAASVFGRLGVPFSRRADRHIGARYEHRELRAAFVGKDGNTIREIATGFGKEYPVWAWKLPAIQRDFEFVAELVPNPHFVIIFKEPLSVAARKTDLKGKNTLNALEHVLTVYRHMASIASKTEHPLLLVSYDRAMASLNTFLPEAARFAGVDQYDAEKVTAGIREDGKRYFRTGADAKAPPSSASPVPSASSPPSASPRANAAKAGPSKTPRNNPFSYL